MPIGRCVGGGLGAPLQHGKPTRLGGHRLVSMVPPITTQLGQSIVCRTIIIIITPEGST